MDRECDLLLGQKFSPCFMFPLHDPEVQGSGNDRMTGRNLVLGVIFLSQTAFGLLGNSSVFYNYLLLYFTRYKLNFADWILNYLIVANFLTLLCKGVPQTMAAFGLKVYVTDFRCKLLFYLHNIGRVHVFAAAASCVSSRTSPSAPGTSGGQFKDKTFKHSGFFPCFCCILNILTNISNLLYMTPKLGDRNVTSIQDFGSCPVCLEKTGQILHAVFLPLPDAVCLGLMVWASISTLFILYRHKQRRQHVPRTKTSPRSSTESRAIKTILLQVSILIFFYIITCFFQLLLVFLHNPSWFLVYTSIVISGCFPSVSPFLLMTHCSIASSHCAPWMRNL